MALIAREGILSLKWLPRVESVRYGRRVNVQRPRTPHYERAKYLALMEPMYKKDDSVYKPPPLKCKKHFELNYYKTRPENPLEIIIAKELFAKFESSKMICFVHTNPIRAEDVFRAKVSLKREKMYLQVHSKHTIARAFSNTHYEAVLPLFESHSAIIFSQEPCVHTLLKVLKKIPQYTLMAGIIDGKLLSVNQLKTYAQLKDVTTARAQLVGVLNSCAQQTVSQLMAHPQRLLAQLHHLSTSPDKS